MVTSVTLRGERLCMTPCAPEHVPPLFACADERTFEFYLSRPERHDLESFRAWHERGTANPRERVALTMVRASGAELDGLAPPDLAARIVGSSSYMDILPAHKAVEIGSTWIHPAWRGTFVNPASKLLMLAHAFDVLGCERVQLKSDARNAHSRAAMAKLGATFEGVLRRHRITSWGYVRDTAMFSIIRDEWPQVREGLERRARA